MSLPTVPLLQTSRLLLFSINTILSIEFSGLFPGINSVGLEDF